MKGEAAVNAQVVLYNLDQNCDPNSVDMTVKVTMGCLRIVFLNWFVANILVSIYKVI